MMRLALLVLIVAVATAFHMGPSSRFAKSGLSMANIVDTAVKAGSFKTLVAAVTAAGLAPTLSGAGTFSVFAPTDEAFAKLPAGTVDALLKDIPKLTSILKYHVVDRKVTPRRNGMTYETINGKEISVKVTVDTADSYIWGGQARPAKVVTRDIECDNGVIHVIDEVLIPYEGNQAPQHN